jgi:hypothetical protein
VSEAGAPCKKTQLEWAAFRERGTYLNMQSFRVGALVAGAACGISVACTTEDSLLDGMGGANSGGTAPTGGASQAGSTPGPSRGGATSAQGGSPADGGDPGSGIDAGSGGDAGRGAGGIPSEGGEPAAAGGQSGGSAGTSSGGGAGSPDECPPGQIWCPGCTAGTGQCADTCDGTCPACSEATELDACEALEGCHAVFEDPNVCGCAENGCCARFARCAPGEKADCEGRSAECNAATPFCDSPAYVVSYSGSCFEGCVQPKDCGACGPPGDPSGCACYSDQDCAQGNRCYGADCGSQTSGTCRVPPANGCFGHADCPGGQTCVGGRPAPCGTTIADGIGTCTTEACAAGDCLGSFSSDCTCSDGNQCVPATGPTGSGQCRSDDGTCVACRCAAPDTAIATPSGERAIADLEPGELVYSVDGAGIRAVKILRVNRTTVSNHRVLRVRFDNGRAIDMTAEHPLADGLPLSSLRPGSDVFGANVVSVTDIPYEHDATYDILPDSTSGAYFASGVLIGSTLARPSRGTLPGDAHEAHR